MQKTHNDTWLIMVLNAGGVIAAYLLLALSLYKSVDVPLATKGYWGMGIVLLTLSLINLVKYRFDTRASEDRIQRIEDAKHEKLLEEFISDDK
ncbi:hypothetical protein SAMN04488030_1940 [Aliiroseovarius halocynthiae]|uniref:YiaAB two helix domain-containing protein n=1 Tax=Aliiroseovarius halocynthiae TaxID=985055 RepID=A0A545SR55_9RHOB|nr:hypothetical protein [Aliiroseovarius halocynthiae]TQV67465.1 hypothetical protein FIL88_09575 [Aliiroseovarius halocynthiae]SMR81473.1 hypothetical protein SAMN04488030_1940 [Aliiroseovarius halocynthiae]